MWLRIRYTLLIVTFLTICVGVCCAVRQKTKELIDLVQDDDRLREERKKAKKNKDKYTGVEGGMGGGGGGGSYRYSDTYDENPSWSAPKKTQGQLGEIDNWESGGPKNIIEEGFGKVKDIISKARGLDEPPEGG